MNIQALHQLFLESNGIVIDTRKIIKNVIFLAIKGDRFDANTFAKEALKLGASYVIIDDKECFIDQRTILVANSLETLQELSKFHRNYLNIPIIALTGSNGKTTTKELIHIVLSKKYNTKATVGNLNNHIGVPLTLLSFNKNTEIGIVEMGANHQNEIEFLCEIAQPDLGYITNFGKAHLEGFGGVEGVIKGKSEMYSFLRQNNKKVIINLDDTIQIEKSNGIERISFSQKEENATIFISKCSANPLVTIDFRRTTIKSHLIGLYNANNIIAAITIGNHYKVSDLEIKVAIESFIPDNNRSQLLTKGSNEIILDAYNANPSSMKVALENFIQLENPNKIAILGDMFELGSESLEEHKSIIDSLLEVTKMKFIFIGNDFYQNKIQKPNFTFFKSFEEFQNLLQETIILNHMILIKGSRGMALERSLDLL